MMMKSALDQGVVVVHGDGRQTRSLTHVDDLVRGIQQAGELEDLSGMVFNLGSECEITMLELAQQISRLVHQETEYCPSWCLASHSGDSKRRTPNLDTARETLAWNAEISLEQGLLQSLRSML